MSYALSPGQATLELALWQSDADQMTSTDVYAWLVTKRARSVKNRHKSEFCIFLEEPLKLNLISHEDAQKLIQAVQQSMTSLTDAHNYIGIIVKETKPKK